MNELSETEKQTVSTLATVAAGLVRWSGGRLRCFSGSRSTVW
ncbi:VENN motif pre-toxin domain-containing protein [Escherichia coli]|nr:VENN motif pre-toxin domain-containing protein [Escherichia coli]